MSRQVQHQLECQGHTGLLCCWRWWHCITLALVEQHDLHYDYFGSGLFGVNATKFWKVVWVSLESVAWCGLSFRHKPKNVWQCTRWSFGLSSMDDRFMFLNVGLSTCCAEGESIRSLAQCNMQGHTVLMLVFASVKKTSRTFLDLQNTTTRKNVSGPLARCHKRTQASKQHLRHHYVSV